MGVYFLNSFYDEKLLEEINQDFEKKYTPKKKYSLKYANVLERIGESNRCQRVKDCATYWEYGVYSDKSIKFHGANFCKDVLCPVCAKRKSNKLFGEVLPVVQSLVSTGKYAFLFVTLTIKDVYAEDLDKSCDLLRDSYNKLLDRKRLSFVKGSFRSLEVTHDNEPFITRDMYFGNKKRHINSKRKYYDKLGLYVGDPNPHFDQYHPHLHAIWIVDKNYFKSSDYIDQKKGELSSIWKDVLFVDYTPVCHIKRCVDKNKNNIDYKSEINLASAVAEVVKYSVKGSDFLGGSDELNEKTVKCLLQCFKNRKMFVFTGLFRQVREQLNCSDSSTPDINVIMPSIRFGSSDLIGKIIYSWCDSRSIYKSFFHKVLLTASDIAECKIVKVNLAEHFKNKISDVDLSDNIE